MKCLSLFSLVLLVTGLPVSSAAAADDTARKPSPTLASLPAPAAAGAIRILLVDDDFSDNNRTLGDKRVSVSDTVFRQLVSDAVGGDKTAWAIEVAEANKNGPGIDRLRNYSLILWYTGASYGGSPDNSAALSIDDEQTVRSYLEEVGGVVILISPGYAERALSYDSTWEKSNSKFLSEVMGVRGGVGLAQRFEAGAVVAPGGASFNVGKGGTPETQFSAVNPDGATVLFTSLLKSHYSTGAPMPVATVHPYGRGRIIYVGFTFENLAEADRAPAFQNLLSASGLLSNNLTAARRTAPVKQPPAAPEPGPAAIDVTGTPTSAQVRWRLNTERIVTASPITPAQTVKKPSAPLPQAPGQPAPLIVERLVPNAPSVKLNPASPDATEVLDAGPLTPGQAVTYRVTVTDANGTGFKEATYTPPLPKDPDSLSAAIQADGSIVLSWPEVPGVKSYQITAGVSAMATVRNATEWRSARLDDRERKWTVNSVYEPGGSLTAKSTWPSVTTKGTTIVGIPAPGRQFLILPNGAGSYGASQAHFRTRCSDALLPGSLCTAAGFILTSGANWLEAWERRTGYTDLNGPNWPSVHFTDVLDLGVGRTVNCTPRKNGATVCWALSHSNVLEADWTLPKSLSLIIMEDDKAFFGNWEWTGTDSELPRGWDPKEKKAWKGVADIDFSYAKHAPLSAGVALDSQGRKGVPHACLSCHGGRIDPATGRVIGASLLPLVPGRLSMKGAHWLPLGREDPFTPSEILAADAATKSAAQEPIRRINQIILQSNPAPAIVDQINAMYNGAPGTAGTVANDAAVPSGWRQQPGLYKKVIEPYCASCHFAQRGPMNFRSWGNLLQHKDAVQRTICTDFTMPHSEILFKKFWTEDAGVLAPNLLSTALGFPKCR